ncbi:DUF2800 domain-containing protein [bacterium]|nr:DUF2800 domain-containing protein [bacterium]
MTTETETKHMKYGGSKMELFEACPGARKAIDSLEVRPAAGPAAERGTRIHGYVEDILKRRRVPRNLNEEEAIAVKVCDKIAEICEQYGYDTLDLRVEEQVLLNHLHPEAGGTADYAAFKVFRDLLLIDLKTGKRYVAAEDNIQLMFYTIGVLQSLSLFERAQLRQCHLAIIQPEQEEPYHCHVRVWTVDMPTVVKFEERIRGIISRAEKEPDNRIPGDHCEGKYCDARRTCLAYQKYLNAQTGGAIECALQGSEMPKVTAHGLELAKQYSVLKKLKDWIKCVENETLQALESGHRVPGYELQERRGNRQWASDAQIKKVLRELGLKPSQYEIKKLITPAQAEALLKKNDIKLPEDWATFADSPYIGKKVATVKESGEDFAQLFAAKVEAPPVA